MKKKSASRSAFFNLRVLIGLCVILAGACLALFAANPFGRGTTASAAGKTNQSQPPISFNTLLNLKALPPGFDCSKVHQLGIDKQDNMLAGLIMIACGYTEGGSAEGSEEGSASSGNSFSQWVRSLLPEPLFIGGTDVDVILPDGTFPHVTQSESMEWGNGSNTWVVNYNDSRTAPSCYSGLSYSTDNGATWHAGQALCTGHGTNFGDPIVVYNARLGMWFAGDLATGCGGQGIGLWTSPDGVTWSAGACAYNTGSGDRESMWVDNNLASPFYGRMYISLNDFNIGGGALRVVYSDNGTAWTPVTLNGSFIRDVQITGDLQGSGRVYVAAMNEEGGGLTTRQNLVYRSTDGGATWANSNTGPAFPAVGRTDCTANSYFVCMFGTDNWRHMGWGEPAAVGNVVSLDYSQQGASGDRGDVYYVRSTDAGVTWGTPVKLNTDSGTAMQWQPSLTATADGVVFASWYDQREVNSGADLNCTAGSPSQNCYRRWGRVSFDNGATWQPDDMVGQALTPLPGQPDGGVQPNYQGDYDYHSAVGNTVIGGWTDGRNIISGQSQQDVFVNFVQGGTPSPTPTASPSPTASATASPTPTPTPTPTSTPACTVVNGDFETGSLPPWVNTGDTSFTGVGAPAIPHSGVFALFSGPTTSDGFIDQTIPTVAGQGYDVSFWLDNEDASNTNRFGATFGSVTLVPEATQGPFGYTLFTFTNVVPGANADLHFIFYNPPSYFYLDDVCVITSGGGSPTPTPTATATATATATPTATATATGTPRPTPTPRGEPSPRPRPTPPPRP